MAAGLNTFFGVRAILDARPFVEGANRVNRAFASNEYIAGRTSKMFEEHGERTQKFMKGMGYVAGGAFVVSILASMGASVLGTRVFGPMLEKAEEFQFQFANMMFLTGTEAGTKLAKQLEDRVTEVAFDSPLSRTELTKTMNEFLKLGFSKVDAMAAMEPVSKAIESTFGEIAGPEMARLIGLIKKKFDFQGPIEDQLYQISDTVHWFRKNTKEGFTDIQMMMSSLGGGSNILKGDDFQSIMAVAAGLSESGKTRKKMMENIRSFSGGITKTLFNLQSGDGAKRFKKASETLGIQYKDLVELGKDGQFKPKGIISILTELQKARERLQAQGPEGDTVFMGSVQSLFQKEVSAELFEILSTVKAVDKATGETVVGAAALELYMKGMAEASGLTQKGAEAFRKTWKGTKEILIGALDTLKEMFGMPLLESLQKQVTVLNKVLKKAGLWLAANPKTAKKVMRAFTMLLTVLTATAFIFGTISAALTTLLFFLPAIETLFGLFAGGAAASVGGAFLAFVPVLVFLVNLGLAFWFIWNKNLSNIQGAVLKLKGNISLLKDALYEAFSNKDGGEFRWSQETENKLKASGVSTWFESLLSLWTRLEQVWNGFTSALDFGGFEHQSGKLFKGLTRIFNILFSDEFARSGVDFWRGMGITIARTLNLIILVLAGLIGALADVIHFTAWLLEVFTAVLDVFGIGEYKLEILLGVLAAVAAAILFVTAAILLMGAALSITMFIITMLGFVILAGIFVPFLLIIYVLVRLWQTFGDVLTEVVLTPLRAIKEVLDSLGFINAGKQALIALGIMDHPKRYGTQTLEPSRPPSVEGGFIPNSSISKSVTVGEINMSLPADAKPEEFKNAIVSGLQNYSSNESVDGRGYSGA